MPIRPKSYCVILRWRRFDLNTEANLYVLPSLFSKASERIIFTIFYLIFYIKKPSFRVSLYFYKDGWIFIITDAFSHKVYTQ